MSPVRPLAPPVICWTRLSGRARLDASGAGGQTSSMIRRHAAALSEQSASTNRGFGASVAASVRPITTGSTSSTRSVYGLALLLGVLAAALLLPWDTLAGSGAGWNVPGGDQAQTLAGHLAYQADQWRWPLLTTDRLFWPHDVSIAMTDSNPLMSLLAKLWGRLTGAGPANWLGAFLGVCWLLQPVAAVYAARGLGAGPGTALVTGVMAACWPALMVRMWHINLCAHFLVLLALGLTFRLLRRPPALGRWWVPACLLLVAVLTHPYLFQLCAAVLGAVAVQAVWRRPPGWWRDVAGFALSGVVAVGLLALLSGPISGGDKGFTTFSMNLLSPLVPQLSGVFGATRPVIDATGGQYEGYNWLGAGTMLLLVVTLATTRPRWDALTVVLAGLAVLSLSSVVYAGPVKLLDLGTKPWEDLFGSFRSSGRAFWPVGYAVLIGCVVSVGRLRWGMPVLLAAAALQVIDLVPLATGARAAWVAGSGISAPAVPVGTTMLTVAPHPGCGTEAGVKQRGPVMLLHAVEAGARIGDIGLGRSPKWFSCERIVLDALELPLASGEVRAFFGPAMRAALRPSLLGGRCVVADGAILCGRDVTLDGEGYAPAEPATTMLGGGWVTAADGAIWSEGPRSTLVLHTTPGQPATLHLRLTGIAFAAGGVRTVGITIDRAEQPGLTLPDGIATDVTLALPPSPSGLVRVALDAIRPVDPARRGLVAPVRRAALRLQTLTVE